MFYDIEKARTEVSRTSFVYSLNRYPKISVFLSNKLRRDRLWSPAFLDPPFRWRVGDGYFSTSKLVTLFIHLY